MGATAQVDFRRRITPPIVNAARVRIYRRKHFGLIVRSRKPVNTEHANLRLMR
jgi:hypothetical protein